MKVLLYCTKGKPYLSKEIIDPPFIENEFCLNARQNINHNRVLNGKIVAECEIDKVEEIRMLQDNNMTYETKTLTEKQLLIKSCLEGYQLGNYLGYLSENEYGYALHLSNLKIFDKPLSFKKDCIYKKTNGNEIHTKAPQNMCNVYDRFGNHYVLISIQPQHLVNILKGKKTIEVRKSILKALKVF